MANYKGTANKYNSTPRKVFDKAMDRMQIRLGRVKEDCRSDLLVLVQRIRRLENELSELNEHVQQHCHVLNEDPEDASNHGTGEPS